MQCRAGMGACPDTMDSSGTCTNDVSDVTGFVRDGQQCVAFTRPFSTSKRDRSYCLILFRQSLAFTFVHLLSVVFAKNGYMFDAVLLVSSQMRDGVYSLSTLLPY